MHVGAQTEPHNVTGKIYEEKHKLREVCVRFLLLVVTQVYGGFGADRAGEKDALPCKCGALGLKRGICCEEGAVIAKRPIVPTLSGLY